MIIVPTKLELGPLAVQGSVLVAEDEQSPPLAILSVAVVQLEDGSLAMNWAVSQSEWRPYRPGSEEDTVVDLSEIVPAVHEVLMPIALQLWRSSPSYRDPDAQDKENEDQ